MDEGKFSSDLSYDFSDTDEALIKCFRIDHPDATQITTRDQIMTLVNYSESFRKWYLEWKTLRTAYDERPAWIGESPEDLKLWKELEVERRLLKQCNQSWQAEINKASKDLRDVIDSVERKKKEKFRTLNPILAINMLNVNNLREKDLLQIALEPDLDKRDQLITKKVTDMQKHYFIQYKETKSVNLPFLEKED
jgi:hypothetical protein